MIFTVKQVKGKEAMGMDCKVVIDCDEDTGECITTLLPLRLIDKPTYDGRKKEKVVVNIDVMELLYLYTNVCSIDLKCLKRCYGDITFCLKERQADFDNDNLDNAICLKNALAFLIKHSKEGKRSLVLQVKDERDS